MKSIITLSIVAFMWMAHPLQAAVFVVPNGDFESPVVASQGNSQPLDAPWVTSGNSGVFNEDHSSIPSDPDGAQWGFIFENGNSTASIWVLLQAGGVIDNDLYAIQFELAKRTTLNLPQTFTTSVWAGDPGGAGVQLDSSGGAPVMGINSLTLSAGTGNTGADLYLRFDGFSAGAANFHFILLDDVSAESFVVPEASTLSLIALAGTLIFFFRRTKVTSC